MIRISTNHIIDYRRKRKQETVSIEEIPYELTNHITPEKEYVKKEEIKQLECAIKTLPDLYKIPIVLYHQQGLRYQEIADTIGEPLSKVKIEYLEEEKCSKKV